ncbi:MAG: Na+/H+ antiporter subunit E [Gammaproteobacteria bacterium]|nr:Na+/H+ antiporter subunit E [Gammaproteobacteria bacterium]
MPISSATEKPHDRSQPATGPDRRQRWIWGLQITCILAVIWLALTGLEAWLLGLVTVTVAGFTGAVLVPGRPYPWRPARLVRFTAFFLYWSIRGGLDVARRALAPGLPISPRWLRYRIALPPGQPRTLLVSILSLLPGTLSADLEEADLLVVHALTGEDSASVRRNVHRLESEVAWFFSLPEPDCAGSAT